MPKSAYACKSELPWPLKLNAIHLLKPSFLHLSASS